MAVAAVEEKCPCGAEFAMTVENEDDRALHLKEDEADLFREPIQADTVLRALREWRQVHAHARSKKRRGAGFLAAISGDRNDGEADGEWQGMYASPAEDDDD